MEKLNNLAPIFRQVALLLASYARIEGMKALNTHRRRQGYSDAYGEEEFNKEADLVNEIAEKLATM